MKEPSVFFIVVHKTSALPRGTKMCLLYGVAFIMVGELHPALHWKDFKQRLILVTKYTESNF